MKRQNFCILILFSLCLIICLTACNTSKMQAYYLDKTNYIKATGIVNHVSYNEDHTSLYLGFSDLIPNFEDDSFKIVGNNLPIVQEKGIDEKIKLGDKVDFISAPKYFGDGYVMPIVEISVNGEVLLSFEDGYANLLSWLNE